MNDQEKGYAEQRARMRNEEFVQGTNERNREYIPPTPPPSYSTQRSANNNHSRSNNYKSTQRKQKKIRNQENKQKSIRQILTIAAFCAGCYYFFTEFNDNLILAGIVGVILGYIAYKWYKAIIVIAIIIGVIYFVKNDI